MAKKQSFIRGAFVLGICGFIGKFLGAVYRIPLTNILGSEGMGLYQMVFPMYTLLLTVSSSGLPSAISRLIAERLALKDRQGGSRIFGAALLTLFIFGGLCTIIVFILGKYIAQAQGNPDASYAYMAIAPSLILVALISAFRGYFQGFQSMVPSAVSQITEQAVKMGVGLFLAYRLLKYGIPYAAMGAVIGISLSELVTLVILALQYMLDRGKLKPLIKELKKNTALIYSVSIPITLGGIVLPLTQLIDSVLIINLLTRAGETVRTATSLYGLSTGPVNSLINMPVVLSLAIGAAIIPAVSAARVRGDGDDAARKSALGLKLTMLIALPSSVGLLVLARPIIDLLYSRGLESGAIDEPAVTAALLMILSASVFFIAFIQVSTSILQAVKKNYLPVINLGIGAVLKIILNILLTPKMGIYGSAIATLICYGTAFILDMFFMLKYCPLSLKIRDFFLVPALCTAVMGALGYFSMTILSGLVGANAAVLIAIAISLLSYFVMLAALGAFTEGELGNMPGAKKILRFFLKGSKNKPG